MDNSQEDSDEDLGPSKSELKRRMHALQALGASLVDLSDKQLAKIPIEDDALREAIVETRNIRSNSARKRHLQLIGKLMRHIDPEPLNQALTVLHQSKHRANDDFHALEELRDLVLRSGDEGIQKVLIRWPEADRQQLRQLVLQHRREQEKNKPPTASRRLFRHLKELNDNYGSDE